MTVSKTDGDIDSVTMEHLQPSYNRKWHMAESESNGHVPDDVTQPYC